MRVLLAVVFSSLLVLGACGTTENEIEDETETSDSEMQDEPFENENQDDQSSDEEVEDEPSNEEMNDQSTNEQTDDQLNFTYDAEEVKEFELEIELLTNEEWDYEFDREDQEAEIEYENGSDSERKGSDVFAEIEDLLTAIEINHERPISEMIDEVLDYLDISRDDLEEISLEIETFAGEKLGFKYHIAERDESATINEFDMDIEFLDDSEWEYEYELSDQDFSIEYSDQEDVHDQEAKDEMERILSEVTIDLDQSIGSLKQAFIDAINVKMDQLKEWDFEVEYEDQMKIGAKFDRS